MGLLREKCKSVDDDKGVFEKRVRWLMEEIEVHLERQAGFEIERDKMLEMMREKDEMICKM